MITGPNVAQRPEWQKTLATFFSKSPSKSITKLIEAGFKTPYDLLWIIPLKIEPIPPVSSFTNTVENKLFRGHGTVLSFTTKAKNFHRKGATLKNITASVQDRYSNSVIILKWFNSYSSLIKRIETLKEVEFIGIVTTYNGQRQIINPEIEELISTDNNLPTSSSNIVSLKVQYPTINSVTGRQVKTIIDKIPRAMWDSLTELLPSELLIRQEMLPLGQSFKIIHGKETTNWTSHKFEQAKRRLIYEELWTEQLIIHLRKNHNHLVSAPTIKINSSILDSFYPLFPYRLTPDQQRAIIDIQKDLHAGHPMMRLIQGDVGCGKTSVALVAALMVIHAKFQVAIMCPTESLAQQHFLEIKTRLPQIHAGLLSSGQNNSQKKETLALLQQGEISILVGTHALLQPGVIFKNLALVIIDEQHKFGVNQRLQLTVKQPGTHCLIMTATPIPRSLGLTRYGDLDVSTIKTMPPKRKIIKTRIVGAHNFQQFLTFVNTRLSLGEQAYIVVPAIHENEDQNFLALEQALAKFSSFLPNQRIAILHGRLRPKDKENTLLDFAAHKNDILLSTSVIEVGINIPNATIMVILSPERFGLSSLHQLRGRVGRGEKASFCFLINDRPISSTAMARLKIIEQSTDGLYIAEEDLKLRGQGDLLGTDQSGHISPYRLADLVRDQQILYQIKTSFPELLKDKNIADYLKKLSLITQNFSTI